LIAGKSRRFPLPHLYKHHINQRKVLAEYFPCWVRHPQPLVATAPQQFEKRYIKLGLSDGINIEVISGLTAKDKIKVWNRPLEN